MKIRIRNKDNNSSNDNYTNHANENHTDGIISMNPLQIQKTVPFNYNYSNNTDMYQNQYNKISNLPNSLSKCTYDGTKFGTCSVDGTIRLWDLNDYSVYFRLFINPTLTPTTFYFTDEVIFSGWSDGKLRTYQISNSKGK